MAKKIKSDETQLTLLDTRPIESHSIEAKEIQEVEKRLAPDTHPALVEFRNRILDEHCRKYPDGLCAYFRYGFRKE